MSLQAKKIHKRVQEWTRDRAPLHLPVGMRRLLHCRDEETEEVGNHTQNMEWEETIEDAAEVSIPAGKGPKCLRVELVLVGQGLAASNTSLLHGRSSDSYLVLRQQGVEVARTEVLHAARCSSQSQRLRITNYAASSCSCSRLHDIIC